MPRRPQYYRKNTVLAEESTVIQGIAVPAQEMRVLTKKNTVLSEGKAVLVLRGQKY